MSWSHSAGNSNFFHQANHLQKCHFSAQNLVWTHISHITTTTPVQPRKKQSLPSLLWWHHTRVTHQGAHHLHHAPSTQNSDVQHVPAAKLRLRQKKLHRREQTNTRSRHQTHRSGYVLQQWHTLGGSHSSASQSWKHVRTEQDKHHMLFLLPSIALTPSSPFREEPEGHTTKRDWKTGKHQTNHS